MNGLVGATSGGDQSSAVLHRSLNFKPAIVTAAKGSWLTIESGRSILDATGGAAVSCIGHGDQRVKEAIVKQLDEVAYIHSGFFGTRVCEDLARLLVQSTGGVMQRCLFLSSGSEAMESALKLARQYFLEVEPKQYQRTRFIARKPSYHGNTLGALAVSGHMARKEKYMPLLADNTSLVSPAFAYRGQDASESEEAFVSRLVQELDEEFQRVGPENVCAFIAEPVVGAAMGVVPAPKGYFPGVKKVCEKYGALLILDEVMCGMGRTGTLHAWQHPDVDVTPDLQTIGKGLGAGYAPIAALLAGKKVADVMQKGTGMFANGHTYQGHPTACAAALAVQKIVQEDQLLSNVVKMGALLYAQLSSKLKNHPYVGDIRGRGLFWGIEIVQSKATKQPFPVSLKVSERISEQAMNAGDIGISVYPCVGSINGVEGDIVILAPAYNATAEEIMLIADAAAKAITAATTEVTTLLAETVSLAKAVEIGQPAGEASIPVIVTKA